MAENVKVIVRCRPMNRKELELNCKCVVKIQNCLVETWDPNEGPSFPKQFTFDSAYDQDSITEVIYNDICYPLVESVLEGYNATIFVYGQTGCGKSFTMEGIKENTAQKGVISRAFEHIFEAIAVTTGVKYLAMVSYLEIYNEQIRDLLLTTEKATPLTLKETPNEGVTVPGLTCHPVHNATECENFLNVGSKNRIIGATLMNQNSSRSHSIFTISIEQISNLDETEGIRKGKLNLVDLAGSERQTKTGATGDRLKEATKINLSLSALGNVISALVDGKAKHIPYRDSKLTRLLQDSLGGNTRTLMIACVSPASRDYMETLSTLRYANRAKNIYNKPKVNEDPKDAMVRQYQEEIERLKSLLEKQMNNNNLKIEDISTLSEEEINDNVPSMNIDLDAKRDKLIQEYQAEMQKLKNLHENEKQEKEIVIKQIQSIKEEYQKSIQQLNEEINEKRKKEVSSKEEIVIRIERLKAAMIGGEKANDKELSERRRKKKIAAEKRASVIAHLLAKIDMDEDRELLHNQYKSISEELHLKTEALRKFRYKSKMLEKEISDLHSEFERERVDYLETIRKQDKSIKLLSQISEKLTGTLKKECNYSDIEAIKEQAVWLDESQRYKLPDIITPRTKLPPAGQNHNRTSSGDSNVSRMSYTSPYFFNEEKPDFNDQHDIIGSYFQPTMKRAHELLNQSSKFDATKVINTWRGHNGHYDVLEYAKRNRSSENLNQLDSSSLTLVPLNQNSSGTNNSSLNGSPSSTELFIKKPFRLEALPNINMRRNKPNTMEFL